MDFGALLLPAALVFGAPENPEMYAKGLFCDSVALVERVATSTTSIPIARRMVANINADLGRNACIYAVWPEVRMRLLSFQKAIQANDTTYSVYEVQIAPRDVSKALAGDAEWMLLLPKTMYTLRAQ